MKPGRELDALVAEKVMGWERRREFSKLDGMELLPLWWDGDRCRGETGPEYAWSPSTDIVDAWEAVERMEDDDFWCTLTRKTYSIHPAHESDPMWECYLRCVRGGTRNGPVAAAETAPHAICLAALRAVGVEVDDG